MLEAEPSIWCNGDLNNRLPGNSSLTLPDIDTESLIFNIPVLGLAISKKLTRPKRHVHHMSPLVSN